MLLGLSDVGLTCEWGRDGTSQRAEFSLLLGTCQGNGVRS